MGQHVKSKKLQGNSAGRPVLEGLHNLCFEGATETFWLKKRGESDVYCRKRKKESEGKGSVWSGHGHGEGFSFSFRNESV